MPASTLGRHLLLSAIAASALALPSQATTYVAMNRAGTTVASIGNLVMGAKYRVSSVNFDQSLDSGGGTQNVSGGSNFISTNLGNVGQLSNVTYGFTLRNIAGQGILFSLTNPSNVTRTMAWGTFSPALNPAPTASAAKLRAAAATGQTPGTLLSPGQLPMNALHLEVSSRVRPTSNGSYAPVVTLSDVAFTATGVALRGSMIPGQTVRPNTSLTNPNFPEVGAGWASQWLLTNGDFWDLNWTLSGKVNARINNLTGNPGDFGEWVKFGISGKQVVIAGGVPEPASWAMLISGLGLVGLAMRRQPRLQAA